MAELKTKSSKITFKSWLKKNNIEVSKRTYYWVADDGGSDYRQVGKTKSQVTQSLKEEFKNIIKLNN